MVSNCKRNKRFQWVGLCEYCLYAGSLRYTGYHQDYPKIKDASEDGFQSISLWAICCYLNSMLQVCPTDKRTCVSGCNPWRCCVHVGPHTQLQLTSRISRRRVIWEKISTREPCCFSRGRSLSIRSILPANMIQYDPHPHTSGDFELGPDRMIHVCIYRQPGALE